MKINRVGISFYNGSKYIKAQIKSIIKGFGNLGEEYINQIYIYNDGSNDKETSFLNSLVLKYNCIKLFNNKNRGVFRNFMQALADAQRDSVDTFFFCDQDDIWLENKFVDQIREHKLSKKALVIMSSMIWDPKINAVSRGQLSAHGHNFSIDIERLDKIGVDFTKVIEYYEKHDLPQLVESFYHDSFILYLLYSMGEVHWSEKEVAWHRVGESLTTSKFQIYDLNLWGNYYDLFFEYKSIFLNLFNVKLSSHTFNKIHIIMDTHPKLAIIKCFFDDFAIFIRSKYFRNLVDRRYYKSLNKLAKKAKDAGK